MDPSAREDRGPEVVYVETDVGRTAARAVRWGAIGALIAVGLVMALAFALGVCALLGLWAMYEPAPAPVVSPTPPRPHAGALVALSLARPGAVLVPRVPGARAARRGPLRRRRGEGKIKGRSPTPRFPAPALGTTGGPTGDPAGVWGGAVGERGGRNASGGAGTTGGPTPRVGAAGV